MEGVGAMLKVMSQMVDVIYQADKTKMADTAEVEEMMKVMTQIIVADPPGQSTPVPQTPQELEMTRLIGRLIKCQSSKDYDAFVAAAQEFATQAIAPKLGLKTKLFAAVRTALSTESMNHTSGAGAPPVAVPPAAVPPAAVPPAAVPPAAVPPAAVPPAAVPPAAVPPAAVPPAAVPPAAVPPAAVPPAAVPPVAVPPAAAPAVPPVAAQTAASDIDGVEDAKIRRWADDPQTHTHALVVCVLRYALVQLDVELVNKTITHPNFDPNYTHTYVPTLTNVMNAAALGTQSRKVASALCQNERMLQAVISKFTLEDDFWWEQLGIAMDNRKVAVFSLLLNSYPEKLTVPNTLMNRAFGIDRPEFAEAIIKVHKFKGDTAVHYLKRAAERGWIDVVRALVAQMA